MKYEFIAEEHEEFGELGWKLKDCPGMDPLTGMAVAHDVLEHFSRSASIEGELMALGASLWIRGDTGYFQKNGNIHPPSVHIATDIPNIFSHILDEGYSFPPPPKTRKLRENDWMENQIADFKKYAREELKDREMEIPPQWLDWAGDYLRRGFRKAQKRWPDNSMAVYFFEKIEKAAKKPDYEGQILIVWITKNDVKISIEEY